MEEVKTEVVDTIKEENKKPSFMQRLASGLIDGCLIFLAYWGLYTLFMNSPVANSFDYYNVQIINTQDAYKLETGYGEKVIITDENKNQYTNYYKHVDENNNTYVVVNVKDVSETVTQALITKLKEDATYQANIFNRSLVLYGINVLSGTIATGVFLLGVPLFNKRRATIGQLAAEISMYSVRWQSYARWYHILFRYLFLFILEGCLPFLFFELYTFLLMPAVFLLVGSIAKSGRTLHDLVSGVKPIDKKSYVPLIPEKENEEVKDAE